LAVLVRGVRIPPSERAKEWCPIRAKRQGHFGRAILLRSRPTNSCRSCCQLGTLVPPFWRSTKQQVQIPDRSGGVCRDIVRDVPVINIPACPANPANYHRNQSWHCWFLDLEGIPGNFGPTLQPGPKNFAFLGYRNSTDKPC